MKKPRTWNGLQWWYCHPDTWGKCNGVYRIHEPRDCRGMAKKRPLPTETTTETGGTNAQELKLAKAMSTIIHSDATETIREGSDYEWQSTGKRLQVEDWLWKVMMHYWCLGFVYMVIIIAVIFYPQHVGTVHMRRNTQYIPRSQRQTGWIMRMLHTVGQWKCLWHRNKDAFQALQNTNKRGLKALAC